MSRQLKELRSLMPWTWDARIDEHPAGKSSLRDFKDVYSWTGEEQGRRAGGAHRDGLPVPPPRKRPQKGEQSVCGPVPSSESTPRSKQAMAAVPMQTPNTRDSGASSGDHLSLPAATPGTILRSSGRSGKSHMAATPVAAGMKTPAPPVQRPSSPPDSAISTGGCALLHDASVPPRHRRAVTAETPELPTEAMVASAAKGGPAGSLPAAAAAGGTATPEPTCVLETASMPNSAEKPQAAGAASPPKPFEAKLAAVDAEDTPSPAPPNPTPPSPQPVQQAAPQQPTEPLEHETAQEAEESEETIAAATLLELPQFPAAHPAALVAAQRRPMQALDTNSRRDSAANNDQKQQPLQRQQQRPSNGLLDAAWAATGIARRPPQQKRSARRPTPAAARALSPRLLSQFRGRQRPALPPVEAPLPPQTQPRAVTITTPAAAPAAAPAEQQAAQPPAALPTASAPPPAVPVLPPIAPLDLQRLPVRLTAELPATPAARQGGGGGQQLAVMRLTVQRAAPSNSAQPDAYTSIRSDRGASWRTAAGPFTLPSPSVPLKRPGDPLDLAHACKLLKWMDALENARRTGRQ